MLILKRHFQQFEAKYPTVVLTYLEYRPGILAFVWNRINRSKEQNKAGLLNNVIGLGPSSLAAVLSALGGIKFNRSDQQSIVKRESLTTSDLYPLL